jgi:PEP-CTERM motif
MKKIKLALNMAALLAIATTMSHAQEIGVHFDGLSGQGDDYAATVDGTIDAGLIPQLNFNNIAANTNGGSNQSAVSGTQSGLLDSTGATTGVDLSYSSINGVYAAAYAVNSNNEALLATFLDSGTGGGGLNNSPAGSSSSFTLTGLNAGVHTLVLYIGSDSGPTDGRGGIYTINGTAYKLTNNGTASSANGTFTLASSDGTVAGNYFETTFTGTSLDVATSGQYSNGNYPRAPIDGFQVDNIAAAPEPNAWALMGTGLLALAFVGRRRLQS